MAKAVQMSSVLILLDSSVTFETAKYQILLSSPFEQDIYDKALSCLMS